MFITWDFFNAFFICIFFFYFQINLHHHWSNCCLCKRYQQNQMIIFYLVVFHCGNALFYLNKVSKYDHCVKVRKQLLFFTLKVALKFPPNI